MLEREFEKIVFPSNAEFISSHNHKILSYIKKEKEEDEEINYYINYLNNISTKQGSKTNKLESKLFPKKNFIDFDKSDLKVLTDEDNDDLTCMLNSNEKNFKNKKNFKSMNGKYDKNKKNIPTFKDKLTLSDLEMYYKFGFFPYILLVHLFMIMLTTYIVFINFNFLFFEKL